MGAGAGRPLLTWHGDPRTPSGLGAGAPEGPERKNPKSLTHGCPRTPADTQSRADFHGQKTPRRDRSPDTPDLTWPRPDGKGPILHICYLFIEILTGDVGFALSITSTHGTRVSHPHCRYARHPALVRHWRTLHIALHTTVWYIVPFTTHVNRLSDRLSDHSHIGRLPPPPSQTSKVDTSPQPARPSPPTPPPLLPLWA